MTIISHNLFIEALNAYIDPNKPVDKAIITHAHADHAIANHKAVLATEDTINIMKIRYGEECAENFQVIRYGEKISINKEYINKNLDNLVKDTNLSKFIL